MAMSRQHVTYEGGRTGGRVQAVPPQSGVTACLSKYWWLTLTLTLAWCVVGVAGARDGEERE